MNSILNDMRFDLFNYFEQNILSTESCKNIVTRDRESTDHMQAAWFEDVPKSSCEPIRIIWSFLNNWKLGLKLGTCRLDHSRYLFNGSSKLYNGPRWYGKSSEFNKGDCKLSNIWYVKQFCLKILILCNLIDKYNLINE